MESVAMAASPLINATEFVQFAVLFFNKPGNKNVPGETPWLPVKPPHPAQVNANTAKRPGHTRFRFNLTCEL